MLMPYNIPFHFNENDLLVVDEPIVFSFNGKHYTVEKGYATNGMSIPRIFWDIISPPFDIRTLLPSIIHDWIYDNHITSRKEADMWYRDRIIENGMKRWKAYIVYISLRVFGGKHW